MDGMGTYPQGNVWISCYGDKSRTYPHFKNNEIMLKAINRVVQTHPERGRKGARDRRRRAGKRGAPAQAPPAGGDGATARPSRHPQGDGAGSDRRGWEQKKTGERRDSAEPNTPPKTPHPARVAGLDKRRGGALSAAPTRRSREPQGCGGRRGERAEAGTPTRTARGQDEGRKGRDEATRRRKASKRRNGQPPEAAKRPGTHSDEGAAKPSPETEARSVRRTNSPAPQRGELRRRRRRIASGGTPRSGHKFKVSLVNISRVVFVLCSCGVRVVLYDQKS